MPSAKHDFALNAHQIHSKTDLMPRAGNHAAVPNDVQDPAGGVSTPSSASEGCPDKTRREILLVDSEPVTRYGLSRLINQEPDLRVCGEAGNPTDALHAVKSLRPEIVLTALMFPNASGLDLSRGMQALHPEIPVLVLSSRDETIFAERVLRAGARGYVMKREDMSEILDAIRQVLRGEIYVSRRITTRILAGHAKARPAAGRSELEVLSDREFEVFLFVTAGLTPYEIGERLHISPKTVDTHRWHIKEKLHLPTLPDLTRYALRWGASSESA